MKKTPQNQEEPDTGIVRLEMRELHSVGRIVRDTEVPNKPRKALREFAMQIPGCT